MLGLLTLFGTAYALLIVLGTTGVLWQMNRPRRKTLAVSLGMGGPGDPADLELEGEEVTFNLADGSASPGWIVNGDAADGPVAVVVHGHRDSRYGSLYRAQMLRPYVSACVVFDLPGHGDAAAASCKMGEREPADVMAVLDGLPREMLEGRGVVLLGYSMGGVIAIRAAARFKEKFGEEFQGRGVIACAPYRLWDEGLRGQMRRRGLPQWPLVWLVGAALRLAGGRLGQRPGFDLAEDAAALDGPLLVLHGDADTICPLDAGRRVADAAPHGTFVVIPGGTHNQLLAADYDAVHAALRAFFESLGKPR
ncbi:MAG: alpha/beta fold hydrolase [Planctomycetota bacterium]